MKLTMVQWLAENGVTDFDDVWSVDGALILAKAREVDEEQDDLRARITELETGCETALDALKRAL